MHVPSNAHFFYTIQHLLDLIRFIRFNHGFKSSNQKKSFQAHTLDGYDLLVSNNNPIMAMENDYK